MREPKRQSSSVEPTVRPRDRSRPSRRVAHWDARWRLLAPVTLAALALVACTAAQPPVTASPGLPGFWLGLWQGFVAPITFIVSLFTDGLRIYAFPNAGRWYDFGFMLGIGGFSGGAFAGFRRRR